MYSYESEKRRMIERLSREMATFYIEWQDEMTETSFSQFVENSIYDIRDKLYNIRDANEN